MKKSNKAQTTAPNKPLEQVKWIVVRVKHALGPAFRSVGLTPLRLNNKQAYDVAHVIRSGIEKLEAQPRLYPALAAVKSWGPKDEKPIDALKTLLACVMENPNDYLKWSDQ